MSARGGTFNQVLILLNGIPINATTYYKIPINAYSTGGIFVNGDQFSFTLLNVGGGSGEAEPRYVLLDDVEVTNIEAGGAYGMDASNAGFSKTVPTLASRERFRVYIMYSSDTNTITLNPTGQTIGGQASWVAGAAESGNVYEFVYNNVEGTIEVKELTGSGGLSRPTIVDSNIVAGGQTVNINMNLNEKLYINLSDTVTDLTLTFSNLSASEDQTRKIVLNNSANNSNLATLTLTGNWIEGGKVTLSDIAANDTIYMEVENDKSNGLIYYFS